MPELNASDNQSKSVRPKTGGRQAGTPNKNASAHAIRLQLADILEVGMEQFILDLEELKPRERIDAYLQMAKIVIPAQKAVEFEDLTPKDKERKFTFNFVKKSEDANG